MIEKKNTFEYALQQAVTVVNTKPFSEQSPSERAMFAARIGALISTRTVAHMFMDNLPHIVAAIDPNPTQKELKILKQRLTKLSRDIKNLIPLANEAVRVSDLVLTASKKPNDNVENAGYLCADMIRQIHYVSMEKFGLVKEVLQMIADGVLSQEEVNNIKKKGE